MESGVPGALSPEVQTGWPDIGSGPWEGAALESRAHFVVVFVARHELERELSGLAGVHCDTYSTAKLVVEVIKLAQSASIDEAMEGGRLQVPEKGGGAEEEP